jgi:outer membrane protein
MTRKLATTIAVVFVLSLAALAQAPAAATKIAVIDLQGAIVGTNEGQRDFAALQKTFEPKRNELQAGSTEIEKLKNQLSQQEKLLNDDSRAKLMKDIDTKQKQWQRNYEDATNDFGSQQNEIANRIGTKLFQVVQKYAASNGYAAVLNVNGGNDTPGPVLWAAPSTDITKAVIEAYNAQSGVPAQPAAAKPAAPSAAKPAAPAAKK